MAIKEDVLRMYENNVPVENIADALGVPAVAVTTIILKAGVELQPEGELDRRFGRLKVGPEVRKSVLADYRNWVPQWKTLKRLGLTRQQYWRILSEEGAPIRRWKAEKNEAKLRRDAEIVDLYLQGMPVLDICEHCGVPQGTLCDVIRKYNVPRREPKWNTPEIGPLIHPRELLDSYD